MAVNSLTSARALRGLFLVRLPVHRRAKASSSTRPCSLRYSIARSTTSSSERSASLSRSSHSVRWRYEIRLSARPSAFRRGLSSVMAMCGPAAEVTAAGTWLLSPYSCSLLTSTTRSLASPPPLTWGSGLPVIRASRRAASSGSSLMNRLQFSLPCPSLMSPYE